MKELKITGKFRDGGSTEWKDDTGKKYWLDNGVGWEKRGGFLYEGHPNVEKFSKPFYGNVILVNDNGNKRLYSRIDESQFSNEELLPPYQKRIVIEKKELDLKIKNLQSFIEGDSIDFNNCSDSEKSDLKQQLLIMYRYSQILKTRINRF